MERANAQAELNEIKSNPASRNAFIEAHKPFIQKVASQSSKRSLSWENDEALSIALSAFNEAIDQYKPNAGAFLGFAKLVIKRRLIDFYRKEARHKHIQLEESTEAIQLATQQHQIEIMRKEQQQEIAKLASILQSFNISFQELVESSPSHRDTRDNLLAAAEEICQNEELVHKIMTKHKLPLRHLVNYTSLSKKMLKTWRRYLLALIVIGSHEDLNHIRSFIGMKRGYKHV